MKRFLFALAVIGGCATRTNEGDPADATLCSELRDHVVEIRLLEANGVDLAAHREALQQALSRDLVASCSNTMTIRQAKCALGATTGAEMAMCTTSTSKSEASSH